jgi:hypothetical protein
MKTGLLGRGARGACVALSIFSVLAGRSFTPTADAAIVQTVTARADAYVRSAADKKSFGFETQLDLRMNAKDGASEGYVQFPLPQHAPFAEKVVLRIYAQLAEPGAAKVLVRSVAPSNWTELGLTWRTRPEHKETLGAANVVGLSGAWYEVDVTAYALEEAMLGREAVTFALVPGDESRNRVAVQAHESAQKKPELVFTRHPLSFRVSFIPTNAVPPLGYYADQGHAFSSHTNGFTYGWSADNRDFMRDRSKDKGVKAKAPDRRYDFMAYMDYEKMKAPVSWELALPNGEYRVRIVAGDLQRYDSIFGISAENVTVVDGVPDANKRWLEGTANVTVSDGRLTIGNTTGSSNNKLCFIEVTEVETLLTQTK